jgi:hypothetical protein
MSKDGKPLITIVGASSKQGRSAAHSLLNSGRFRVRALTGRPDSAEAQSLAGLGAEVVRVPLGLGHQDELTRAFRGSHGAFLMTPAIVPPATHEADLGRQQADAALAAGVQHVVFSSLENVHEITAGTKYAPHFTDKARVEQYIRSLPVRSSFIYLALFFTNLLEYYPPRMEGDTLLFPIYLPADFAAPFVDPLTATGPAIVEIFSDPDRYTYQSLPVIGEMISPRRMIETFASVTGKKVAYRSAFTRAGLLEHFPHFGANELLVREILGMVEYIVEYGYYRKERDVLWSRRVNAGSLGWEQFLRASRWQGQRYSFAA